MSKRLYPFLNNERPEKIFKDINFSFNFQNYSLIFLHEIEKEMYKTRYQDFIEDFCKNKNLKLKIKLVIDYFKTEGFSEEFAKICIQQEFIKQLHKALLFQEKKLSNHFIDMNDFLQVILIEEKKVDILQEAINIAGINFDYDENQQNTNHEIWRPWNQNNTDEINKYYLNIPLNLTQKINL